MAEQRKVTELRGISVNANKQLVLDIMIGVREGEAILGSRSHVQGIQMGTDIAAYLKSVSDHLVSGVRIVNPDQSSDVVSYPPISDADIAKVKAKAREVWGDAGG